MLIFPPNHGLIFKEFADRRNPFCRRFIFRLSACVALGQRKAFEQTLYCAVYFKVGVHD